MDDEATPLQGRGIVGLAVALLVAGSALLVLDRAVAIAWCLLVCGAGLLASSTSGPPRPADARRASAGRGRPGAERDAGEYS